MQKVLLSPFYLIAATFIGLGDTLYLAYYHLLGVVPGCALKGCEIVLTSSYATPLGMPLAYLGLFFYATMVALVIALALHPTAPLLRRAVLIYTAIGLLSSVCFETIQFFIIHAFCMYCGISAVTTLILFCLAVWHWRATRVVISTL